MPRSLLYLLEKEESKCVSPQRGWSYLGSVAQLVEWYPMYQEVIGSIPGQVHAQVADLIPSRGCAEGIS